MQRKTIEDELTDFLVRWHDGSATLTVHTSGSTGTPKAIEVEKQRMLASAKMTCDFLGLQPGDSALLCMPLRYIAGMMMVVRSLERGLRLFTVEPNSHPLHSLLFSHVSPVTLDKPDALPTVSSPPLLPFERSVSRGCRAGGIRGGLGYQFIAMVPLQVYETLQQPEEKALLMQTKHLLIGGGSIDAKLEAELRTFPHAVWSSYGMTETLSHIALRRLNGPGASEWYTPLEGVTLSQDADGCLIIDAPHLCAEQLHTNDIVQFNSVGQFKVMGRRDNVICSGGIKIQIEEVEAALRPVFGDTIQVTSRTHPKYGQEVVYLTTRPIDEERLQAVIPNRYWLPKAILLVPSLPRTGTGKPDRAKAKELALS